MFRIIRSDPSRVTALASGAVMLLSAGLVAPHPGAAQEVRQVMSKNIAVSRDEAALRLELDGGDEVEIAFRNGEVFADGEAVGSYEVDGPVVSAWRALLGQAVALENGPLADALLEWEPPEGLDGSDLELARLLDERLEERLSVPAADPAATPEEAPSVQEISGLEGSGALGALLGQGRRLRLLGDAVDGVSLGRLVVRIDQDVTVARGERIDGDLLVVGGDAEILGTVDGNVIVVDGELTLGDGSEVMGDIRLAEARLRREGGAIGGRVRSIDPEEAGSYAPGIDAEELRREIERDLRDELRSEIRQSVRAPFRNPLRHFFAGFSGVIQNLITFAMLAGLGLGVLYIGRSNLEVVAEAAQTQTLRSAMVGTAGAFLVLPVWILGTLALVVSVIGIPVAIAWIPLFPVAAGLAAALGYLAVALKVGEWLSRKRIDRLEWVTESNPFYLLVAGLGALMIAFVAANVASMAGPFLGFVEGLLNFFGGLVTLAAMLVGFGAVLLTRGGREPLYAGLGDLDLGTPSWSRSRRDPHLDDEPDFGPGDPFSTAGGDTAEARTEQRRDPGAGDEPASEQGRDHGADEGSASGTADATDDDEDDDVNA